MSWPQVKCELDRMGFTQVEEAKISHIPGSLEWLHAQGALHVTADFDGFQLTRYAISVVMGKDAEVFGVFNTSAAFMERHYNELLAKGVGLIFPATGGDERTIH